MFVMNDTFAPEVPNIKLNVHLVMLDTFALKKTHAYSAITL